MSATCLPATPRARRCPGCLQSLLGRFRSFAARACFTCCEGLPSTLLHACAQLSLAQKSHQVSRMPGRPRSKSGHS